MFLPKWGKLYNRDEREALQTPSSDEHCNDWEYVLYGPDMETIYNPNHPINAHLDVKIKKFCICPKHVHNHPKRLNNQLPSYLRRYNLYFTVYGSNEWGPV